MSTRVSKLANVIVPVADQDRALQFYTEALGFEKHVDADVSRFGAAVPPLFWFRDPEGNTLMVVAAR